MRFVRNFGSWQHSHDDLETVKESQLKELVIRDNKIGNYGVMLLLRIAKLGEYTKKPLKIRGLHS